MKIYVLYYLYKNHTTFGKIIQAFAVFDGIYLTLIFTVLQAVAVTMSKKYGGYTADPALYGDLH